MMTKGTILCMSDVTVVCCWTNEAMYNDFVNTLKSQSVPSELIGIDNRGNKGFTSCASAYNSVIDQVKTKYVIYSHQDILLNDSEVLSKFLSYLETIGHDDILGVAGVRFESPEISTIFTNIKHIHPYTGELISPSKNRVDSGIIECDTVDECFFGGYTEHFRDYPFDSEVCDDWHLYAAEACMNTKVNAHAKIWVCSSNIIHRSAGNVNSKFIFGFCRLCRKYANDFPFIRATCGSSLTDERHLRFFVMKYYLRAAPQNAFMKFMGRTKIYVPLRKIYRAVKKLMNKE